MRHRQRRRNFIPTAECLERRIALSAEIGVSLNTNNISNNDPIWTDLHNLATSWTPLSSSSLALSADGYPLASASVEFATENYPDGTYGFSYTGAATVTFSGVGQLVGPVTVSDGVTTGTVVVNNISTANYNWLIMQVTGVNPANPMDNFHLMMPGYGNGTSPEPMFTPAFLQALEPFSDIRFVNWDQVDDSTLANWSNRVSPTDFTTDSSAGVPYEDMIELCNEAQKDMWINIPVMATPQFVQSLAQLIQTNLDPNLNVYVEYGNENWNTGFTQYGQVLAAAQLNPLVTQSSNTEQMVGQQSAYEEVQDAQIFNMVFGSGSAQVRPIMAGWNSQPSYQQYELQFIQQTYGPPSQFVYATAVAPYIALPSGDNVAGLTVNQIFTDLTQYLTTDMVPWLKSDAAVAAQYGVPLVAYEGGQSLVPGADDLNFSVMQGAQNDPRMNQLYVALMNDWQEVGGGLFDAYNLDGGGSQFGFWGLLPNVLATGSQKYDALLSMIYPTGDADLNGIVNYADFQTLETNYGDTNVYWEQGDFNGDGTVNWQDLNLLRQNLDPAEFTLSEFAQQAVFGQLSTVIPGQSLEYDGYGVTYASSMPFSASSGTVKLNENSQGTAIVLGGVSYSQGLGVLANSSVSLNLNGQDTQFDTTIGVDGSSNTGSSVIFDVYGDGKLLYQSPTLTYASGAVPIAVNVAGVHTLTLVISAAPGSTSSSDHAVWADARLVSTANFGSGQPYALTWQLSQNGTVVSTQTTDSFVFGAISGTYTLTLTVTNAQGDTAAASTSVVVTPATASASHYMTDSLSEGQWMGTYGVQGYYIVVGSASLPNYATVTLPSSTSAGTATWAANTTDPRALEIDGGTSGVAAALYGGSFTIGVNLTDGQAHNLTLYAVDWDNAQRSEKIQILSAATGAVLDTETIASFSNGVYLRWTVSGDILIKVTLLAGPNAVISGLFFDAPATTYFTGENTTTQGNWIGTYGSQGYDVIGDPANLPSYATITPLNNLTATWAASTTDPQALENPGGSGRIAACWWEGNSFTVNVNLTDGQAHLLTLYAVDWDKQGRSEQIQILNPSTGAMLDSETISSFTSGVYLQWVISGSVTIKVTRLAGANAVLSGIFLDPPGTTFLSPATTSLSGENTTAEGNWIGTYGSQGYDMIGDAVSLPSYATITTTGANTGTWAASTTDPRALQNPSGTGRIAACWYGNFTVNVNLTDGQAHLLSLYAVDWDKQGRSEQIQILNPLTGAVLDSETISSFTSGVYLQWVISGSVTIKVTRLAGVNAVLSGIFLDPATTASAAISLQDTPAQGSPLVTNAAQGYDVVSNTAGAPGDAPITNTGGVSYTWLAGTIGPGALQNPSDAGLCDSDRHRYSSSKVYVNPTDAPPYELALAAIAYDRPRRSGLFIDPPR